MVPERARKLHERFGPADRLTWSIWHRTKTSLLELQTSWTVGDLLSAAWMIEAQDLIDEANSPESKK
jgi:hypothetical protein